MAGIGVSTRIRLLQLALCNIALFSRTRWYVWSRCAHITLLHDLFRLLLAYPEAVLLLSLVLIVQYLLGQRELMAHQWFLLVLLNYVWCALFRLKWLFHPGKHIFCRSAAHAETSEPAIPVIWIRDSEARVLISTFGRCGILRIGGQSTSDAAQEIHFLIFLGSVNSSHGIRAMRRIGSALVHVWDTLCGGIHCVILLNVGCSADLLIQENSR